MSKRDYWMEGDIVMVRPSLYAEYGSAAKRAYKVFYDSKTQRFCVDEFLGLSPYPLAIQALSSRNFELVLGADDFYE